MESRKTHLINEKGEKLVVETRDFNISQQNGDGKDSKDKLTIEEAENLTIEKVRKIYEHNGKL